MKRLFVPVLFAGLAAGCGGGTDLPPTTDPDAIKREQERLGGPLPGGSKASKDDAIRREQERLRGNR